MKSMYLAVGYRCNHYCYFCPCGRNTIRTGAAPIEALIAAIDQGIQEKGIEHLIVSGGEPTCHPKFNRILRHCVDKGLRVSILSNGDNFSDMEATRRFFENIDPNVVSVVTAVHSDLENLFEKVTRTPGSYHRTIEGVSNLIRMHISVTVKQVISKWNYKRLPDFVDFVFRHYGPSVSITLCGMDFCGMEENSIREVAVSFKEAGPWLEKALDIITDLRIRYRAFPNVSVTDLPLCCVDPAYWGYFTSVSRKSLSQYSAPGKIQGTVESISDISSDCDIFANACRECAAKEVCPGVWKTAYDYFGEDAFSRQELFL